jgi:hypothetical protein
MSFWHNQLITHAWRRQRVRAGSLLGTLIVLSLLLIGPGGALALLQTAVDGPSPAQGHAQVIANGVAGMPADQIAWRVVVDSAENLDTAQPLSRPLGFALADQNAIVINDITFGTQNRLAAGEASFVQDNQTQQRASLTDSAVPYYGITLVPAENASQASDADLVFGGDGFAAPSGNRDIDLVRDVLAKDGQTTISDSGFPVLVLATAGTISIQSGGEPATLQAGEASQLSGDLQITGVGNESAFVAAVIGPEVPPPPRFTGTISLGVFQCPAGVTADDLNGGNADAFSSCTGLEDAAGAGFNISLTGPNDTDYPFSSTIPGTRGATGVYVWTNLPFGDYTINDPSSLPSGSDTFLIFDQNNAPVDSSAVTISRDTPDVRENFYLLTSATGSLTARVYNCPEGMTPETMVGDDCDLATEGFDLKLSGGSLAPEGLTLADATNDGGVITWNDLALSPVSNPNPGDPGTYHLTQTALPDGYESYIVTGPAPMGDGGDYVVLTADQPAVELAIYNFFEPAGTGTIVLNAYLCPAAGATAEECQATGGAELTAVTITSNDGHTTLDLSNAIIATPTYTWTDLAFGDYSIDEGTIGPPTGYVLDHIENGGVTIDSSVPEGDITVYFAPAGATPTP